MNDHLHTDDSTVFGTIGGTFAVTLLNIFQNDVIRTIGFAALGATVSFFVSLGLKALIKYYKLKKRK
jgi:hypothetical protein